MRSAALLAFLIAVTTGLEAATPRTLPPPHPEVTMELTSYGEHPRDLLALLVPFLAKHHFVQSQRVPETPREGSAAFENPGGDFVVTAGRFNCVVVVYYSKWPWKDATGALPTERAGSFRYALFDFLDGLPAPRPLPREVTFGSKYCADAT